MTQDYYKKALFAARVEYNQLADRRKEIDDERKKIEGQLAQLAQTIDGLMVLCGEEPMELITALTTDKVAGLGLADACRVVLAAVDRFVTPRYIRDSLEEVHYDFGQQTNPLASIHAILKRFVESGEADSLEVSGKTGYRLMQRNEAKPVKKPLRSLTKEESERRKARRAARIAKEEEKK
jgi:hypothetical protein